jgi:hypothetical protein
MAHPLDGARLKIVRAQKHLQSIEEMIGKYKGLDPYVVGVEKKSNEWTGRADIILHPDPMISAVIGDCLHNLSCALDYTIWEVAGTFAGRVLLAPPHGDDRIYFPIYDKPIGFSHKMKTFQGRYKIPDAVVSALESVQPYNAGYEPLEFFFEVVNADKHRLPLITIGDIDAMVTTVIDIPARPTFDPILLGELTPNEADVKTQVTVCVTWKDPFMPPEPVDRTLGDFIKCVAEIIPRFERFVL